MSKKSDHLLLNFKAQQSGTTYVYDMPSMFRQMVERQWKEFRAERPDMNITIPEQIFDSIELVLESDDRLVEQKRLPGQNNVKLNVRSITFH
jgi:acetyl-CoA carboxylase / biotin carboxylase 1